jgi:transposase
MTPADEHRESLTRYLVTDLRRLHRTLLTNAAQIRAAVTASKTTLTTLRGIGPMLAAKILGHTSNITQFPIEGLRVIGSVRPCTTLLPNSLIVSVMRRG